MINVINHCVNDIYGLIVLLLILVFCLDSQGMMDIDLRVISVIHCICQISKGKLIRIFWVK